MYVTISDVPRRRRGHRLAGSRGRREAGSTRVRLETLAGRSPAGPDRRRAAPCRATANDGRDAFRRVASDRVSPIADVAGALFGMAPCDLAHRSRVGATALVRQHAVRRSPRPAPCCRIALRLLRQSRRAMRRTNFCLLTSSYEHPRLVGSHRVGTLSRPRDGGSPGSRQCDSLRWASRALGRRRGGRCCSRRDA